jgi:hypothetical protein
LAIALFIGLPIRLIVLGRATMVSRDTIGFIWYAQALHAQPLQAIRTHAQHPAYPVMVLAAHGVVSHLPFLPPPVRTDEVRSWTTAAIAVSMLGGLGVIVAAYLLAATLFNREVGLVAALLAAAAAEFCQLSADGLTDMPHLTVYLLAMWAGLRGLQRGQPLWFALAGVLAGIGYLFRPEGAEPAVAVAALLVVPNLCRLTWRGRLTGVLCLMAGAAVAAGPYMLATGRLVQKKPVAQFVGEASIGEDGLRAFPGGEMVAQAGSGGEAIRALWPIAENWLRSLRGTYFVPVIAWLVWRRRMPGEGCGLWLIRAAFGLHVVVLVGLLVRFHYWESFSLRHVMILAGLTLPFAAAGVVLIVESLPEARQGWAAMLLGAALVGPTVPWMFQAKFYEDASYRTAADWIQANTPHRPRVLTVYERIAFYARGDYIPGPWKSDARRYLRAARMTRPDWIAFDERRTLKETPTFFEDLAKAVRPDERVELVRVETAKLRKSERRVLIYRYEGPR